MIFITCIDWLMDNIDHHLSKYDTSAIPQGILLSAVIHDMKNTQSIIDGTLDRDDITSWNGLTVDENERVIGIDWAYKGLSGFPLFAWIPNAVEKLFLNSNKLAGRINLALFPDTLKELKLHDNTFDRTINLANLPTRIEFVSLSMNRLWGSIRLDQLPKGIRRLFLNNNEFSGSIRLTSLPNELVILSLHTNMLSGSVDFTCLPVSLQRLYLYKNSFSGNADFGTLPDSLQHLDVSETDIEGNCSFANASPIIDRIQRSSLTEPDTLYSTICVLGWIVVLLSSNKLFQEIDNRFLKGKA